LNDEASSSSEAAAETPKKRGRPKKVVDADAAKRIRETVKGWKGKTKTKAKRAPRKRAATAAPAEEYAPRGSAEAVLGMLVHAGLVTEEQVAAARVLAS
jgi:hypothetical protein